MLLFWLSLAFIIGILLAAALPWAALTWFWLAGGALLLLIFLLLSPRWFQFLSSRLPGLVRIFLNRLPLRFAQRLSQELIANNFPRPGAPSLKILIALSLLALCLGGWRYTATLPLFHGQLNYLVVAGPREEQITALPSVVERFPLAEVLWAGSLDASDAARYLQRELTPEEIPIIPAEAGHVLDLGQGARLEVLSVSERGMIQLLQWRNFRALLALGIDFAALEELRMGKEVGAVTALLLADNGYAPLNPPEWIANLNLQVVLFSVEAGGYNGLPSPETLETVAGYNLLRTDQHGWLPT